MGRAVLTSLIAAGQAALALRLTMASGLPLGGHVAGLPPGDHAAPPERGE